MALSPTRLLVVVAALAAIVLGLAAIDRSGAAYVASSEGRAAGLGTATLTLSSDRASQAIVADTAGLRPGSVRRGTVTVTGGGTRAGDLRFAVTGASGALADVVTIELERCSAAGASCPDAAPELTETALGDAPPAALGTLAPGAARHFRVTLRWPASAAHPDLQGASTAPGLRFALRSGT